MNVFVKILLFVIAAMAAFMAASFSAAVVMVVGYMTDMPLGATVISAASLGVAVFGITIALFSMANSLFGTNRESNTASGGNSEQD